MKNNTEKSLQEAEVLKKEYQQKLSDLSELRKAIEETAQKQKEELDLKLADNVKQENTLNGIKAEHLAREKEIAQKDRALDAKLASITSIQNSIVEKQKGLDDTLNEIKKALIHQANGKMDDAILKRLFTLYDENKSGIMQN